MQADLHVTHSGIMWMAGIGKEMERDLHAKTIDWYPLAQLNTTLHLYDKQLNHNPSTCRFACLPSLSHLTNCRIIRHPSILVFISLFPPTLSLLQLSLS